MTTFVQNYNTNQFNTAMKKQTILLLVMLLGLAMPILAQNKKVEDRVQLAREKYADCLALISSVKQYEADEIPAVNYTTVVRKQNWAGSGQMVDKMEFYYSEIEEDMEPYPVGYRIEIVRRTYNIGSTDYFEEYVFDDEGKPLFWFSRFGYSKETTTELRGYYDTNGKLIRTICKKADTKGEMKTCDLDEELEEAFADVFNHFIALNAAFQAVYSLH